MVTVIIPARNEIYLQRTINSVLTAAEGDIEVIAVLDGYWPNPPIKDDPRVILIHHTVPIGQRGAINEAAKIARGKYGLKTDGHSMFDQGFDVKLAADCEYDWTVIPRMYNLDVEKWQPKLHKWTDYMYITSPDEEKPFRAMYHGYSFQTPKRKVLIDDVMTGQGACWFMHMDRFWELGGMDERHGGWGQVGIEVALKAWLSGGSLKVNKKTWFAHYFRGGSGPGFPYSISGNEVERARQHSQDLWLNGKWEKQTRPLSWLVKKFNPPGWEEKMDLTILYYTANVISEAIERVVIRSLKKHGYPIISISQEPMDFGKNVCVGKTGRSLQNIYRQVLAGAKEATTEYVALCEDDCFYTKEHFQYRPKAPFAYNSNRWLLHMEDSIFSYRKRVILSQCIAHRETLIKNLEERFALKEIPDKYCGEMGKFDKKLGMTEYAYETFETKQPNMIVCHKKNIMGRKYWGKDAEPRKEIEVWGKASYWVTKLTWGKRFGRGAKPRSQHAYIGSIIFPMKEIMNDILDYRDRRRPLQRAIHRMETMPLFIRQILAGEEFDDAKLSTLPYYKALVETHKTGHSKSIRLMRDMIRLCNDIKANGVKAPLDMWRTADNELVLHRGWRRLLIMNELGYDKVCARIFKSMGIFRRYNPSAAWEPGPVNGNSIHDLAMNQFVRLQDKATDKYWIHGYTRLYDFYLQHLRNKQLKILEFGVLRGASLLLWQEAFPKSQIFGVDKRAQIWKLMLEGKPRIKVFVGHQENVEFLNREVIPAGPYDVIIDDAGHHSLEQRKALSVMWDNLKNGGFYIIEDLHANYKRSEIAHTTMKALKDFIDDIYLKTDIKAIHFHYNICFIEKAQ